jgi:hypothetical protein
MKEKAKQFVEMVRNKGWHVYLPNDRPIITIGKQIKQGSEEEFAKADSEYFYLISQVPTTTPGSMWGTDGGGCGAISAINRGEFIMNRSGVSKRFVKAVREYLLQHPDLNIEI